MNKSAREIKKEEKAAKKALKKQQKALKKQQKKEKKKKKGFFLWRLFKKLVLLNIIAAIIVVCFISPGLLKDKFDPISFAQNVINSFTDTPIEDNMEPQVLDMNDPGLISVRYSDDEIAKAKTSEAKVTSSKHKVTAGGLTVDMGKNNISNEDTLVIRDLGKKEDDQMYTALHCYDLSLKSGKDSFSGNVKITIPLKLEKDEYLDGMVYFNEETGAWEDLYYEVASNNKSVTAYIDHFTKVSPKIGKMTKEMFEAAQEASSVKKHAKILASDDKGIIIPGDLFVEVWNKMKETKDEDILYFQYSPTMRNIGLHEDSLRDLFKISGRDINANAKDIQAALKRLQFAIDAKDIDWPSRILGLGDSVNGAYKDLKFLNSVIPKGAMNYTEGFGHMMAALNIMLCSLKLYEECKGGKELKDAVIDNNLMVCSAAASAIGVLAGAFPALAAWPFTVTAIGIYIISISYDAYRYSEGLDDLPLQEQAYFEYYKQKAVSFDGKGFVCKMGVPVGLGDEKGNIKVKNIKSTINIVGLNDDSYAEWEDMLSIMAKNLEKEPGKSKEYFDDLYYKYADAYWQMPEDLRTGWLTQFLMQKGYDEDFIETIVNQKVLKSDIDQWRKDKIEQTMINFQEELENQIEKYTAKAYVQFKKDVQKQVINPLNQMMYFLVEDKTLEKDMTFYDSLYCQDYRLNEYNKNAYFKKIKFKLDSHPLDSYPLMKLEMPSYLDVVTTMRFADVQYPLFYPYQIIVEGGVPYIVKVDLADRYPHTPEFLPFVDTTGNQPYKNLVFVTNLYHYIQMGSPTRMVFRDVNGITTFEEAQKHWEDPGIEASFTIPKFNKKGHAFVRVRVTGDGELTTLNGYWEGPWLGSSKQWYYFEVDTENKKIYIEDTLGLPTESFTIRFYKFDTKTKTLKFNIGWAKERAHLEFKLTGKKTMVLYIEYNGETATLEFDKSTRERFDNWENRQKFYIPDPSKLMPEGETL